MSDETVSADPPANVTADSDSALWPSADPPDRDQEETIIDPIPGMQSSDVLAEEVNETEDSSPQ